MAAVAKQYFLVKSEPSVYPFAQLMADGKTGWEGVRNYEARNTLRAMKKGDECLFYHSNEGKEIVGIAKVLRTAYQDPTTDEDWSTVELGPVEALKRPVTLAEIKAHPELSKMLLVKRSRISVVAVTPDEWKLVIAVSKKKKPSAAG